ncbi:peptidoglycan DD-metalloendopeptidase family protein [Streptantibioticus parmotrematis]|uniref:peptidoglycan DD-metalloendopeptidase family protein n=1 Tax=Streptantibioticus parmotrematis TaxID=2873249 RepID=UPI0033D015BE
MRDLNRHGATAASPADALHRFLTADPGEWERLAPRVVRKVGRERLEAIVTATRERTGAITAVEDGPDGLVIRGENGQLLAWAVTGDDGVLTGLLIDGDPYSPTAFRVPPGAQTLLSLAIWAALLAWGLGMCWTAGSGSSWLTDLAGVVAGYVVFEGYGEPATMRRPVRWTLRAGALAAVASGWRAAHTPFGHSLPSAGVAAVVCAGVIWTLVRRRRHRWGTPLSAPLLFPLKGGTWFVGQGGGKGLNHHFAISEQRGALDIVAVEPAHGSRRSGSGLESYVIYGAKLYAPCDGTVVSAADGLPDQEPGRIRFGPLYGNHVFIDTGHEIVKMAHLRPGSVAVSTGQTVRAGQLVGEVGNSGNTTEPHLHLHAERDGVGLDLSFEDVGGFFHRGRLIRH